MLLNSDTLFPDKVLSVTYVKGGSAADIISPHAEFGGILRNLTTEGMYRLQKRLHKVVKQQAAVHRCNAYVDFKVEEFPLIPAALDNDSLYLLVERVGKSLLGPENVKVAEKLLSGDDFAFYQELIPGAMIQTGIRNEKGQFTPNTPLTSFLTRMYCQLGQQYKPHLLKHI